MKANEMTDADLDALLAGARDHAPVPSDALMARVMVDAIAVQQNVVAPAAVRPRVASPAERSPVRWFERLAAVFGGTGALAGVSLATVAGVFIGIVQPAPVAAVTSALLVEMHLETVELFPSETALWEEAAE